MEFTIIASIISFVIGYIAGKTVTNNYWILKCKSKSAVFYDGIFYYVITSTEYVKNYKRKEIK